MTRLHSKLNKTSLGRKPTPFPLPFAHPIGCNFFPPHISSKILPPSPGKTYPPTLSSLQLFPSNFSSPSKISNRTLPPLIQKKKQEDRIIHPYQRFSSPSSLFFFFFFLRNRVSLLPSFPLLASRAPRGIISRVCTTVCLPGANRYAVYSQTAGVNGQLPPRARFSRLFARA